MKRARGGKGKGEAEEGEGKGGAELISPSKGTAPDQVTAVDLVRPVEVRTEALKEGGPRGVARPALHLVPCEIHYSGPAHVEEFFRPQKKARLAFQQVDGGVFTAHIRGREMTGQVVGLPADSVGLVLRQSGRTRPLSFDEGADAAAGGGEEARALHWELDGVFDSFTLWDRDQYVGERGIIRRQLAEWPKVAAALHAPVAPSE